MTHIKSCSTHEVALWTIIYDLCMQLLMKMRILFAICVSAFTCACASTTQHEVSYAKVAESLIALNGCNPQFCIGTWYAVDRPYSASLNAESKLALSDCVALLNKNIQSPPPQDHEDGFEAGPAPNEIVAAAQIVTCMRAKGWQYHVDGMIVT